MKYILKKLVDLIYLSPFKLSQFKKKYPNESLIGYGGTKAIILDCEEDVKRGTKWLAARRALFIMSDKRIVAGDWEIGLESIIKAQILCYGSGMVLKLETAEGDFYQFGLQYIKTLLVQEHLEIELINSKVKYSLLSIMLRVFVLTMLFKEFILPRL